MGLMLPPRRLLAGAAPWWRRPEHLLDGAAPAFFADIIGRRYVLGGAAVPLAAVLGVTSGAGKTYCDADGSLKVAAANEARIDWSSGAAELLLEGAATNKITARKHNPLDTSNLTKTGDAAAVLSVVDDSAALAAAGLSAICTAGTVYRLDNSAGSGAAWAKVSGAVGNANAHSFGVYARRTGAAASVFLTGGTGSAAVAGSAYAWTGSANVTPAGTGAVLEIGANAGSVVHFILPQLVEAVSQGSIIPGDTLAAVTRTTDLCQIAAGAAAAIQGAAAGIAWRGTIPVAQSGQQIVGLGDGLNLIRATNTPNTRVAIFNATSALALGVGTDVIPGALGLCAGWGASGARLAVNGTAAAAAQTNAWPTTVYLGASSGLSAGQVLRLRQLVGWTLTDQPSAAGAASQARLAA
ncbi:hypothetical protein C2U72_15935 [Prosthecomicrobium hirschii]|uniref:hypothetical protein n=1 Tax=Prosthecodimorpha hirschii TaxID=665126 RepID=UPI001127C57B|nr:hypothetical protein [Prosthecomicrobium hirschii]TPQ49934.1 hypothetical protein C2U72_15935 [Prosthecomicrobium hirschii]